MYTAYYPKQWPVCHMALYKFEFEFASKSSLPRRSRTSVAIIFGLPVELLTKHTGHHIEKGLSGDPAVDTYGHSLRSLLKKST